MTHASGVGEKLKVQAYAPAELPRPEEVAGKRPPEVVMSPERMAGSFPNALSFTRIVMKKILRDRWRVHRVRIEIDGQGEGEALYRVDAAGWEFHFFAISRQLKPEEQIDRNFASRWDATAALCQGPWSAEREAHLRREIPKQLAGWTDYDTLTLSRGNRSGRLFEHVVDSLATGRQPDPCQLSEVGYILRTTGFLANGLAGTRPFEGLEPDHPLRESYELQVFAAFLFREFVFDLVETMAAARSPSAVRLSPEYKRYLGLGNSAATGLVRYVYNHPRQIDAWCGAWEAAFALARNRRIDMNGPEFQTVLRLLEKAICYFRQDGRPSTGKFVDASAVAEGLEAVRQQALQLQEHANSRNGKNSLASLCEWSASHVESETVEVLHAILLEAFPDIVEHCTGFFRANETLDIAPSMSVAELRSILKTKYDWALAWKMDASAAERFFWFHSEAAPEDARRGHRHVLPDLEHETHMETIRQIHRLASYLEASDDQILICDVVRSRPDLRQIIARVQSLCDNPYAEIRDNPLADDFSPFASIRLVLAFFGMEKFDAAPPKLVRGALLQGAPTAEDVAEGTDGNWPFPLFPEERAAAAETKSDKPVVAAPERIAELKQSATATNPSANAEAGVLVSDAEFSKRARKAFQAVGAPLGLAEEMSRNFAISAMLGFESLDDLLEQLENGSWKTNSDAPSLNVKNRLGVIDANGETAGSVAFACLDYSCGAANSPGTDGIGISFATNTRGRFSASQLAYRAASRGLMAIIVQRTEADLTFTIAGPANNNLWVASSRNMACAPKNGTGAIMPKLPSQLRDALGLLLQFPSAVLDRIDEGLGESAVFDLGVICLKGNHVALGADVRNLTEGPEWTVVLSPEDVQERIKRANLEGLSVRTDQWNKLNEIAIRLLIPVSKEVKLREPGFDATKQF